MQINDLLHPFSNIGVLRKILQLLKSFKDTAHMLGTGLGCSISLLRLLLHHLMKVKLPDLAFGDLLKIHKIKAVMDYSLPAM